MKISPLINLLFSLKIWLWQFFFKSHPTSLHSTQQKVSVKGPQQKVSVKGVRVLLGGGNDVLYIN